MRFLLVTNSTGLVEGKNRLSWQLGNTVTQCQVLNTGSLQSSKDLEKRVICLTRNPQVRLCSEELKDEDRMTHNMTPAADPLAQRVDRWRWGPELSGYLGLSQAASGCSNLGETFASFLHGGWHSR